jgi:uncharacterized membrane protein
MMILVAAFVVVLRSLGRKDPGTGQANSARQILDERYARGELARDEYEQMRQDIGAV